MKNINLDIKKIPILLKALRSKLDRYASFVFIMCVLFIYGLLVYQISSLVNVKPNEEVITQQLKASNRPKIDQATINKIQQLEDQNVGVQSLFKAARDNPFQDN